MAFAAQRACACTGPGCSSNCVQLGVPRVVTLTPAPAIDRVYFVHQVRQGQVNRATKMIAYLAGKGINVARTLHLAGSIVSAIVPMSREEIDAWDQREDIIGVVKTVEVAHDMRTNVILVDETGTTTNVNTEPLPLDGQEWFRLCQAALDEIQRMRADWLVLAGTLPVDSSTGSPVNVRALFRAACALGASVCLDTAADGSMADWGSADQPDLIKPNAAELASMTGLPVDTLAGVVKAATLLRERGIETILVSLGPDGVVEVSGEGAVWAHGPTTTVVNTTGAGDAALAGYLSVPHEGHGRHIRGEPLRRAVAWGALAVQQPTTILPRIITNPTGIEIGIPDPAHQLT